MASSLSGRFCAVLLHLRASNRPSGYICSSIVPALPISPEISLELPTLVPPPPHLNPPHSFKSLKYLHCMSFTKLSNIITGTCEPVTLFWTMIDPYTTFIPWTVVSKNAFSLIILETIIGCVSILYFPLFFYVDSLQLL